MAVKLRLRRMGKKKSPFYRIVAADSRAARDGRIIESIGTYNPLTNPIEIEIKEDRVFYWLGVGAQPTDTVKNLFQKKGLWLKWDLKRNGADEARINDEFAKWQAIQNEKSAKLEAAKMAEEKARKAEEEKAAAEAQAAIEAEEAAKREAEAKAAEKAKAAAEAEAKESETAEEATEVAESEEEKPAEAATEAEEKTEK